MRTDQRNGLRSKAGFALLEVVMTIIIVGLAMGTAAMVLGTAVKVVQMRTALDNRSLAAENCMARIEAASDERKNYAAKFDTRNDSSLRLVTVKADGHTYRRLFSYPTLNATSGLPVLSSSKETQEGE